MSHDRWTAVDQYIDELLVEPDPVFASVQQDAAAAGLPAISVSASQGKLLHLLARLAGARRILELGTLAGFSGIWLARALPTDGRLVTIEADPVHAAAARRNFERAGIAAQVEIRIGAALEVLPQLAREGAGPFDLVFIDADKGNYAAYLDWAIQLARPGTLIVADNVVRDGEVIDERSDDPSVQGARRFMAALAADPRVTATAVQTVGVKGYDGLAFAIVTAVGARQHPL
jgi:predicted O-methyltransferase YrrM